MPYQGGVLEWIDTLPQQENSYALGIHEYLTNKGIKPRKSTCNHPSFGYYFKGERVLILRENAWRHTPLDIAIYYGLKGKIHDINSFVSACSGEVDGDELIKYIINNICCCDRCRGNLKAAERCGGWWVEIAGVRRKLAGCQSFISKWKGSKAKLDYSNH